MFFLWIFSVWAFILSVALVHANCPAPPGYPNSSNDVGDRTSFNEGAEVRYSCDPGYVIADNKLKKFTCTSGEWVNPLGFSCKAKTCRFLTSPDDGQLSSYDFSFPNTISVLCNVGYSLKGYPDLTCQANGEWDGTMPSCQVNECPPLWKPNHGEMTQENLRGKLNIYRSKVTFTCDYGYRPQGEVIRTCLANKTWSGENHVCEQMQCPRPDIGLGSVDVIKTHYTFYETLAVTCNSHTTKFGSSETVTCRENETWEPTDLYCYGQCAVKFGNHATSVPKILGQYIDHGGEFQLQCDDRKYVPTQGGRIRCVNGTLTHPDLSCKPAPCSLAGMGDTISYEIQYQEDNVIDNKLRHDADIKLECRDTYGHDEDYDSIRCKYGDWDKTLPQCDLWSCYGMTHKSGVISNTTDGILYDMGSVAHFSCQDWDTYLAQGSFLKTCYKGKWRPETQFSCLHVGPHQALDNTSLLIDSDVVFLLDVSPSMNQQDFEFIKEFIKDLLGRAKMGPRGLQVSVIVYDQVYFHLNNYTSKKSLFDVINRIPYEPGSANISSALRLMRTKVFHSDYGDRLNKQNVAFLITDGNPRDNKMREEVESSWKKNRIHFIIVADDIAEKNNFFEIYDFRENSLIFVVENFESIKGLLSQFYSYFFPEPHTTHETPKARDDNLKHLYWALPVGIILVLVVVGIVLKDKLLKCFKGLKGNPSEVTIEISEKAERTPLDTTLKMTDTDPGEPAASL